MTSLTVTLTTLGLRDVRSLYFVPLLALLVLLLERELIRAAFGAAAQPAMKIINFGVLPLLAAFAILVGLRLNQIFSGT